MTQAVAAIVPSAGLSRRFGGRNKLFAPIGGVPLIVHTLRALQASPSIRWILPVVQKRDRRRLAELLSRHRISKALAPCLGGATRAESVARGVAALPQQARWVLVHDAARPCLRASLIASVVRAARRHGAVACGLPAAVTVKAADAQGQVRCTLDRETLWLIQTPQAFRRDWFAQAIARADHGLAGFPDDASLVEAAGFRVQLVPGDPLNVKVATQADLIFAKTILINGFQRPR